MGVLGLWQLLAPVGQPVTLESLENKIFAVDISIWLNQALKGYRDSQGGSVANAHLLSLFSRLCKLLFYKIRPVIVFDGAYPELKRQTIINRQQRRAAVIVRSRDTGLKILTNYLASQNLAVASGSSSSAQPAFKPKEKARDEIFKLPPLPELASDGGYETSDNADLIEWKFTNFSKEDIKYLNQIDINSEDFNNLPPDVKQEILSTLKESRKHRTWEQYAELPEESNEFSTYQMQCLLKKRNLSKKLEEVRKDLRKVNSADFIAQYTNDHVIGETNKIMSDDTSHYVLLKKIIRKTENSSDEKFNEDTLNNSMKETKSIFITDMENIDVDHLNEAETTSKKQVENDKLNVYKNKIEVKQELDFFDKYDDEDIDDPTEFVLLHAQGLPSNSKLQDSKSMTEQLKSEKIAVEEQIKSSLCDNDSEISIKANEIIESQEVNKKVSNDGQILNSESSTENSNKTNLQPTMILDKLEETDKNLDSSTHSEISKIKSGSSASFNDSVASESQLELNPPLKSISMDIKDNNIEVCSSEDEFVPCDETEEAFIKSSLVESNEANKNLGDTSLEKQQLLDQISLEKSTMNIESEHNISNSILDDPKNYSYEDDEPEQSVSPPTLPSTSKEDSLSREEREAAMKQLQNDLETATAVLEADQAKQDRQNRTVQEHMVEECKELLQLFGIPYIVSPTEAEAQCAFFDSANMTHGTITDDSDVWLFGGKRVYKNFFAQQKYVEFYKDTEVFNHFSLSRKKLINFALLTGSDYTEGVEGVGPVTAMEILSEFPGEDIEALRNFKEWWTNANKNITTPDNKIRSKLKKLVLDWNFPDEKVCDAYINPVIDSSTDKFTWGRPDLDALREYSRERFGWNKSKVDDTLLPVIKKLNERESQTHLDSFFTMTLKKQTDLFPSKRIMSALKKIKSPQKSGDVDMTETKSNKRKSNATTKTVVKKTKKKPVANVKRGKPSIQNQGPILSEESSDES